MFKASAPMKKYLYSFQNQKPMTNSPETVPEMSIQIRAIEEY
jgi:hypothetical protein